MSEDTVKKPFMGTIDDKTEIIIESLKRNNLSRTKLAQRMGYSKSYLLAHLNQTNRHEKLDDILRNLHDWFGDDM